MIKKSFNCKLSEETIPATQLSSPLRTSSHIEVDHRWTHS